MKKTLKLLFASLIFTVISGQSKLELPSLIGDHMVLQQNSTAPLWGKAEPGSIIRIEASWGFSAQAAASGDSMWTVKLNTPSAGGPYQIIILNDNKKIVLSDVRIGEVWLCSGQSNMEMPLEGWPPKDFVMDSEKEISDADYPYIRLFSVTKIASLIPKTDCIGKWEICNSESVRKFSAVAYFYGKKLFNELKIPIGLIHSSWGGTPAEAWTNKKYLSNFSEFDTVLSNIDLTVPSHYKLQEWIKRFPAINVTDYNRNYLWNNINLHDSLLSFTNYSDSNWQTMVLPADWRKNDIGEFKGFVWFRKKVELPDNWIGKKLTVELGPIDDYDITYANGNKIGSMEITRSWKVNRVYAVEPEINNKKKLSIAVRVHDTGGAGAGIYGGNYKMRVILEQTGEEISLAGKWKFLPIAELYEMKYYFFDKQPEVFSSRPKINFSHSNRTPTVLYNGMIAPLTSYVIKGVIWYQGESNTPDPALYEKLFPAMITNWREEWGYDFPFYYVQIAPYHHGSGPGSQYLRDAQRKSLYLPNTGMAVSLDAGDSTTVHPSNKTVIGDRLALWALANLYGKQIVFSGPLYKSYEIKDNVIELLFDHVGSGLDIRDNKCQFIISGVDKVFKPAKVKIIGDKIRVWSDDIKNPLAVRYAWDNIVYPTLFNKEGLPASSFRTDNWR